jgi:hypothetical protein
MQVDDFGKRLALTMEADVVRSLLAGNDTMCFTTRQYMAGRDQWIERHTGITRDELGLGEVDEQEIRMARKQLQMFGLVKQVDLDTWTIHDGVSLALPENSNADAIAKADG